MDQEELNVNEVVLNKFAKKMASNDPGVRSRNVKSLKMFLRILTDDTPELSLLRLWKGLHYVMWMADKPLYQEQVADNLSNLIHVLPTKSLSIRFFDAFLQIEAKEWQKIDHIRLDKHMMLVRFVVRQTLIWLKNKQWDLELNEGFCKSLERLFLSKKLLGCTGMLFHVAGLLLDEVSKVSDGEYSGDFMNSLCGCFVEILSKTESQYIAKEIKKSFFSALKSKSIEVDVPSLNEKLKAAAARKQAKNRVILYSLVQ